MKVKKMKVFLVVMIMLFSTTTAFAGRPCDECGRGTLIEKTETWRDCRVVDDCYCGIPGRHTQFWYNDVKLVKCTNCDFQEILSYGPDYGWYCEEH